MLFDYLQVIFWCLVYILIICINISYRKSYIPTLAVILNFSWEVAALNKDFSNSFSIITVFHILWLFFDLLIVLTQIICCKINFTTYFVIIPFSIMLIYLFEVENMQLISCFIIDIIMAICFVFHILKNYRNEPLYFLIIGITKFIGDFFAWLMYKSNIVVNVIGIQVIIINIIYLIFAIIIFAKKTKNHYK